jgi:ABC-2 type transport system ATP-binding protein
MNILTVSNLVKKYGDFIALNGVSFSVHEGEIMGFLGPNGAGKTTTINIMTGLARPTSGTVTLAGIDCVTGIKKAQRWMGVVPDESNLYDEMDGFENLSFCAALYGLPKQVREKKATELLKLFGLHSAGSRPFKAYSKGMKRKLTIAAGMIHDPKILFLDEPTTGIDVESARQIRRLLADLNRRGMTIFLTTHYIEEAERLCDRISFIVNGRIVQTGSINSLMDQAQHHYRVAFQIDGPLDGLADSFGEAFPGLLLQHVENQTILVQSDKAIDLVPLIQFFASRQTVVYEARVLRPTLEDIFVRVTGIELENLEKEKEGRAS